MPTRWLTAASAFAVRRPLTTLAAAAVLALLAIVAAVTGITLRTSNLDLVSRDLDEVDAFVSFAEEFGTPNALIIVLEGPRADTLGRAVDALAPALRSAPGVLTVLDRDPGKSPLVYAENERYLISDDGGLFFLFVQPDDPHSKATTIEPFVSGVRAVVDSADLESLGVSAGLTGLPQYALDDRDIIQHDISRLSLLSLVAILVLFAAAFGSIARPLLAVVALVEGVLLTLGVVAVYPGHLTLLSAFFASILFGLGIDFGIHIVHRTEDLLSHHVPVAAAVQQSIAGQAPALLVGALTTASAFLAMNLTDFQGFAELGTVAGIGVLLCLLSMVTVLPALLVLHNGKARPTANTGHGRLARVLLASSRPWTAAAAVMLVLAAACVTPPPFDTDYLNLQPINSETVRLEREMVRRSPFAPVFAVFTVDSLDAVHTLTARLKTIESVSAVRSISDAMAASFGGGGSENPELLSRFKSRAGRYAVYAYPRHDVWGAEAQETFIAEMRGAGPNPTGMPFLGNFMAQLSQRALRTAATAAALILVAWVYLGFRSATATVLVAVPVALTVLSTRAAMTVAAVSMNPLAIMAWPVILGIAVDDGVHLVHRFRAEGGDIQATLAGTGRSIVLTSATTIAAFGTLALTSHRGLASFAMTLTIGVSFALLLSVVVLPQLLVLLRQRVISDAE